ncbi:helix-turn-helix transcriptional regulator [Devosia aquimaris]|uniref:helix-turn-helix transcriptional regulator n=1 Tax=Devosia aquimaris TaxID=2866214 RepID=UPI0010C057E7|nr:helix-turn-helix transcriptional regulator [Devosia sp. CJK-A8-3]
MSDQSVSRSGPIRSGSDLGVFIALTRKSRGYTQQDFADIAGVGRRFVSDLENGKATVQLGKLLQVLTALGLDLEVKSR